MKHHEGPKLDVKHIDDFKAHLDALKRAVNQSKRYRRAQRRAK